MIGAITVQEKSYPEDDGKTLIFELLTAPLLHNHVIESYTISIRM